MFDEVLAETIFTVFSETRCSIK